MDPNKYIKYSAYQMSDSVRAGGLFSDTQCKELARKLIELYDENQDGQLDLFDVGQMQADCYRAMNKNYNPTPTDIAAYTRKMDTNGQGRVDGTILEQLCLKYLSSGVNCDSKEIIQDLPQIDKKVESIPIPTQQQEIVLESANIEPEIEENEEIIENNGGEPVLEEEVIEVKVQKPEESGQPKQEIEQPKPIPQSHEIKPIKKYSKMVQERLKVARRIFEIIDDDKSGFITEQEVPQLLIETYKAMGMTIEPSQEDVELWMEMADLDRDGKVYLADYEELILKSLRQQGISLE